MISEISSIIASLKAAYDITKGINALKADVDRNESISKILEILVSVQFQASAMLTKAHELEIEKYNLTKKLMEFEKWSETERQYDLKEIATGVFVYAYKKASDSADPIHYLCPNCWQHKTKSIIQCENPNETMGRYSCPNPKCKFTYRD